MNKRKLLSVILVTCMMVSLVPAVAFAEDGGVDTTPETGFYSGDGTVYVPATPWRNRPVGI